VTSRNPEKSRPRALDLNMLRAQFLENGWRYRLGDSEAPIGNRV